MLGLLLAVSVPLWPQLFPEDEDLLDSELSVPFTKIRAVGEAEVIAEFLRAEFYQPEFDPYRVQFAEIVSDGDMTNDRKNAIRKTLLFRRRGKLWRELPSDTQWWEVELRASDLPRVRAFPRKQWAKFAEGDFYLTRMIARIQAIVESKDQSWFSAKMRSVAADLRGKGVPKSVLLIGVDARSPLTIIEGNHRMAAAMLVAPEEVNRQFRFYCGLSPNMTKCCWYKTDFKTLTHYAANMLRYLFHDGDYFVQRSLRNMSAESATR